MKKYFITALIILGLGMLSWAQGSKDLFDAKKSEAELEIMKGILGTTIFYVVQNQQKDIWYMNTTNMSAYYLVGQGAVFVIPTSTFREQNIKLNLDLFKLKGQTQMIALEAQRQAAELSKSAMVSGLGAGVGSGVGPGIGGGKGSEIAAPPAPPKPPAPPAPPTPPAPPAPPTPPSPSQTDREELRKKVEDYQTAMKKEREEAAANQQKFLENLKEIRVLLIEALANYGDSISTVKPGEYINLIVQTDDFDRVMGGQKAHNDIITAQKSWITDYKAGRLSLDAFKQKVLQYTE